MNVRILTVEGKEVGTHPVPVAWEQRRVSPALLHQVGVAALTNQRVFRAHTKDRAERRGGGKKPWRQKGTGRARHASVRSPLWRKGGIVFGPRAERTYAKRVTASMKRTALLGALVGKIRDAEFFLLQELPVMSGKTRELSAFIQRLPVRNGTLLLVPGPSSVRTPYRRASKNLSTLSILDPQDVTASDLLLAGSVVTTAEGLELLEKRIQPPTT